MSKRLTTGLEIGQPCPNCRKKHKHGRLAPVPIPQTPAFGSPEQDRVSHLICTRCKKRFEAKDRERNLNELREGVLRGFKNPPVQPKRCAACRTDIVFGHNGEISSRRPIPPRIEYLYCPVCNRIFWIILPLTMEERIERSRIETAKLLKALRKSDESGRKKVIWAK